MRLILPLAALAACAPALQEDVFTLPAPDEVDVLWVVDSSPSMAEERAALVGAFASLLSALLDAGADDHVAVTTTDCVDPGNLVQGMVLTPETPAPTEVFRQLVEAAGQASPGRCGIGAVAAALAEPKVSGANAGFYRDDADLRVIAVSDQDDASPDDLDAFLASLNALKPDPGKTTFSGLIGPVGGCATGAEGLRYQSVIDAMGGVAASICDDGDWGVTLGQLVPPNELAPGPFRLSLPAVEGTISVWVEQGDLTYVGTEGAADLCSGQGCFLYTYDAAQNRIEMVEFVPEPTATVHVLYQPVR
jgi:hypothetical protein